MRHESLALDKPTVVILLIFALVVFLAILKRRNRLAAGSQPWPFYVKRLLTQPEQVLYHRLVKALPNHLLLPPGEISPGFWLKQGCQVPRAGSRINSLIF